MQAQAVLEDTWPKRCHTKIVGCTFEGRQDILTTCRDQGVTELELVRDPLNRYDSHAVAIIATIKDEQGQAKSVRLGFLSNSDRICCDCGAVVGATLFKQSHRLRCPECSEDFTIDTPVVTKNPDGTTAMLCPGCGESVELDLAKVVSCPHCGGTDYGRGGLATRFSRALAAGIRYRVQVMEYTGGEIGRDGKARSMGCNIRIAKIENQQGR